MPPVQPPSFWTRASGRTIPTDSLIATATSSPARTTASTVAGDGRTAQDYPEHLQRLHCTL